MKELGQARAKSEKFEIVVNEEKTIEEKLEIIRAHLEGAEIEYSPNGNNHWVKTNNPIWNWEYHDYRVKPVELEDNYIDWSHVSDEFVALATDENGDSYIYCEIPKIGISDWITTNYYIIAEHFKSFKKGNKPWNESLVLRPEKEG